MNNTAELKIPFRPRHWLFPVAAFILTTTFIFIEQFFLAALQQSPVTGIRDFVNTELRMQIIFAGFTVAFLMVLRRFHRANFAKFDQIGDSSAHPAPLYLFGVTGQTIWRQVGLSFALLIAGTTALFAYVNVMHSTLPETAKLIPAIGFACLLAAGSAFAGTAITRFGVVVALHGVIPNAVIYALSGLVFAIPQYFARPGGIVPVVLAALLGVMSAKSMVETRGSMWAWTFHFLHHAVLFTAMLVVL